MSRLVLSPSGIRPTTRLAFVVGGFLALTVIAVAGCDVTSPRGKLPVTSAIRVAPTDASAWLKDHPQGLLVVASADDSETSGFLRSAEFFTKDHPEVPFACCVSTSETLRAAGFTKFPAVVHEQDNSVVTVEGIAGPLRLLWLARSLQNIESPEVSRKPYHADDRTFEDLAIGTNSLVLVDFGAPWCGPCVEMNPAIDVIANKQFETVRVIKVNVDESPVISDAFGVSGIPAFFLLRRGDILSQAVGKQSQDEIEDWILAHDKASDLAVDP